MIRLAKKNEIPQILLITKACALDMIDKNIYQWDETYPSKSFFENDYLRNELYILEVNNLLIGCIVLTTLIDEEYKSINWLTPSVNNLYVHRLAVHPSFQHKGFAQKLMTFAEEYARKNKFVSVRLDTFSQNKRNQYFYLKRGYQKVGEVFFFNQSLYPFYCYERLCK